VPSKTFKQVFFKPGRYHLGGGIYRDFTASDVAEHVRGAQAVLDAGHGIPILYEHAAPGSAEGSPVQLSTTDQKSARDKLAEQVKHGAGWIKRFWLTKDGEAAHELEVTDPDAAKGLKNGSIKFTSPEFRANWTDGKGREFPKLVSHVALTHKPRNLDQSAIEEVVTGKAPALQFSLADWAQFSSEEEMEYEAKPEDEKPADEPKAEEEKPENPDLDKPEDDANDQQFVAAVQLLKDEFGLSLPDDCDKDSFVRDLLTSLKTAIAIREKNAAENANNEDKPNPDDEDDTVEEKPPIQFSLSDASEGRVANKLLAAVIRNAGESLIGRLNKQQADGTFPPGLVKALTDRAGTMQFSEEGDEHGSLKLSEVVDLLETGLPAGFFRTWTSDQFSVETAPGELLTKGDGEITAEQAKQIVDEQAKHVPQLRVKK
jgi:hypothetical protein